MTHPELWGLFFLLIVGVLCYVGGWCNGYDTAKIQFEPKENDHDDTT
jgi:hypothetical protein